MEIRSNVCDTRSQIVFISLEISSFRLNGLKKCASELVSLSTCFLRNAALCIWPSLVSTGFSIRLGSMTPAQQWSHTTDSTPEWHTRKPWEMLVDWLVTNSVPDLSKIPI